MIFIKKNFLYLKTASSLKFIYSLIIPFFYDDEKELIYIHIGKCGGGTLRDALKSSEIIKKNFNKLTDIHIKKPPIKKKSKYVILIRNPLDRSISAFNYQLKLMNSGVEYYRFKKEHKILKKYKSLENIAKKLYINDKLNLKVAKEFKTIHHLEYDIEYYLKKLIKFINKKQIFAIFVTDYLNEDIKNKLNIKNNKHTRKNIVAKNKKFLSNQSKINLKKFLTKEYEIIDKLAKMYNFSAKHLASLKK